MAFEPNTIIHLLNVPFENDYKNVLYYNSKSGQYNTLISRVVRSFTDFTYQRKDSVIRVPAHIDTLWNCNYVMYQNKNHGDKWFYAFITNMEYINDGVTNIHIETDVYNTWWDDVTILPSFVEREHTKDDTIGLNTTPEGLELGEYKCQQWYQDNTLNSNDVIVAGITETLEGTSFNAGGQRYGGVFSGITYGYWSILKGDGETSIGIIDVINKYDKAGKGEAIQCIFMAPRWLATGDKNSTASAGQCKASEAAHYFDITLPAIPSTINGYEPRNKKLFTYPYRALVVTNQQGGHNILHNEKFNTYNERNFRVFGVLTPGCSIRVIPLNYNNIQWNIDEGLNLGKYPVCNWTSDVFTNWLTQNSLNIAVEVGQGLVNTAVGVATGNTAGATSGFLGMLGTAGQVYAHSLVPNQSKGNINCGDVMFGADLNNFEFQDLAIKPEYASIVDEFFDMFGYKTNRVKQPNKDHRERWWYTKTIDINIDGAIPNNDMSILKDIYNNGVTFWRNINEIQNYSKSNKII